MRARIRNTELYFDIDGMGLVPHPDRMVQRPVLFLLHGGPGGDHTLFKRKISALRDVAQLVYIDNRGSGRSVPCDPETCTLEENVEDVEALRDYLGLEHIALFGSSYGGMIAQGYAVNYPDRVSSLILGSTAPSFRFLAAARQIVDARGSAEQKRVCQPLWDGSFASDEQLHEFFRVMGPLYSLTFDAAAFDASAGQTTYNRDQLNRGFGGFLQSFDYIDRLHLIGCPTLVMAGAHDWICPPGQSELIASKIRRSHLKIFENSAHSISSDETEAFLTAVRGFLTYAPLTRP